MRRRGKLILFISMVVIALAVMHFKMGIFKRHNYFTAYLDKWNGDITIVFYGEPGPNEPLMHLWARRNGFRYQRIAGCDVSTPLMYGAEMYNRIMSRELTEKLGEDWQERMMRDSERLHFYMGGISANDMADEEAFQYKLREGFLKSMIDVAKQNDKMWEMEKNLKEHRVPDSEEELWMRNSLRYSIERDKSSKPVYIVTAREHYHTLQGKMVPSENYIELKIDSATREILSITERSD